MSTCTCYRRLLASVILALLTCAAGFAKSKPEVEEQSAEAVALVEIVHEGQVRYGTAFCVDKSGLFVTSADVVSSGLEAGAVNLVLSPGAKNQQRVRAKLVRWNDALGLSVLRIDPVRPLTVLELGTDASIRETLPVTAYGFPLADGVPEGAPTPAVTDKAVRVTALRRAGGRLEQVQIDGQLSRGYSGSPLVDPAGKVIGVVQSGLRGAGINFAIPVGRLSNYLSSPLILFDPPPIEAANRLKGVDWTIRVAPPNDGSRLPANLAVSVTLPGGSEQPRKLAARAAGAGIYTVKVVPLMGAPDRLITVVAESSTSRVTGVIPDVPLRIDGKAMTLGDLQSIRMSRPPRAFLRDGTELTGEILGLGRVGVLTEAGPVAIDLRRVRVVHILRVGVAPQVGSIEVGLEVRRGTTALCTETRRVDVRRSDGGSVARIEPRRTGDRTGNLTNVRDPHGEDDRVEVSGVLLAPPARLGTARAIRRPPVAIPEASLSAGLGSEPLAGLPSSRPLSAPLDGAAAASSNGRIRVGSPLVRMLPGKVGAITLAGGGRYLLLTMRDSPQLAGYDVRLMSSVNDGGGIPTEGKKLIIVASGDQGLRFRIFDRDGKVAVDTDEKRLTGQARGLDDFRKQLENLWPPHDLGWIQKGGVITAVTSIVGHTQLAIFDASVADVVKIIPLPYQKVLVAGGSEKFVLVFPDQMAIERWDLTSLAREESKTSPIRANIIAIAMGSNTAGPILAEWLIEKPDRFGRQDRYSFIDPRSLKVLKVPELAVNPLGDKDTLSPGGGVIIFGNLIGSPQALSISASDDGSVFIVRQRGSSTHCKVFELAGGMVRTRSFGREIPRLASPDGRLLYSELSVLDWEGNRVFQLRGVRNNLFMYLLPSSDPGYFLGIAGLRQMLGGERNPPVHSPLSLTVFAAGSQIPLVTVDGMDEMYELNPLAFDWDRSDPAIERRFDWVPSAELLVTVPASNDRLCLRRLAIPGAQGGLGEDDLYVTSAGLLRAPSGKKLSHRIEVKSRKGGVRMTLVKGPQGLTLKPDGLIEWNVPNRRGDFEETVVITIEDASGQPLFHRLKIHIR